MTRTAQLIVGAVTDFVLTVVATLTGAMVANGTVALPSGAVWLLALLFGVGAAAKHVRGMALELKPIVVLLAIALTFSGCTLAAGQMTPEQLKEFAKVKDAHAGCFRLGTPYGNNTTTWINADKGVVGKVTAKCDGMEMTIEGPASK